MVPSWSYADAFFRSASIALFRLAMAFTGRTGTKRGAAGEPGTDLTLKMTDRIATDCDMES
jgi:hypothetical protein